LDLGKQPRSPERGHDAANAVGERLARGPALRLDGAIGTELEKRGHPAGLPLWSTHALLDAPESLVEIHAEYARAGAEILTANTFRTQRRTLERGAAKGPGLAHRDAELTALAVDLARQGARASARRCWIAGSAPPLEDCYRPDLVPEPEALLREHARHMENLAEAGVDLVLIETMNSLGEAVVACRAARECGLPALVSFVSWRPGEILSGESLARAADQIQAEAPLAVLVNCLPPSAVDRCLPVLAAAGLPFGAYANLGEPHADGGFTPSEEYDPGRWADHAKRWLDGGARLVGGCCGTGPGHIRAMGEALAGE
jgi:S-methylmethionine-dependent homocysteine/selenocysteine methylase